MNSITYDFTYRPELIFDCDFIDDGMKNIIYLFNEYGLRTKYCCEGHTEKSNMYVSFHKNVTDEQIYKFLEDAYEYGIFIEDLNAIENKSLIGIRLASNINKWARVYDDIPHMDWGVRCYYSSKEEKERIINQSEHLLEWVVKNKRSMEL